MSNTATKTIETSKSPSKPTFTPDMKNFLSLGQKLFGKKEISDVSKIIDENRDLEERISALGKSKDKEIKELRSMKDNDIAILNASNAKLQSENTTLISEKDFLLKEFAERYNSWDSKTRKQTRLEEEVVGLKATLLKTEQRASAAEITIESVQKQVVELQNQNQKLQETLKNVKAELTKKELECNGTWNALQEAKNALENERRELGLEDMDLNNWTFEFNNFMETNHKLAKKFFCTAMSDSENLDWDTISTELYQPELIKIISKKFPLSNSVPSQYLRMAIAETVIAMIYHSDIFQQYYLPECDEIFKISDQLYKENPRREAIFRSQLRYAYKPEAEELRVRSIVQSATDKVVRLLGPLLLSSKREQDFRSEFEKVLQEAVNLWKQVQRSPTRGFVDNEPDDAWGEYDEYHSAYKLRHDQEAQIPDEPLAMLSLFPRVIVGKSMICSGYALWSHQSTVVAADLESKSRNSMNGAAGKINGGIQRRGTRRFSGSAEETPKPPSPVLRHTHNRSVSMSHRGDATGALDRQ